MDALHSAIVFPLICLVLIDCVAKGAVIHVAVTGNDSHNGSAATPFRTISKAAGAAQPRDSITVHEGVYRERINPLRGGTSDEVRIVYQAAPGEKVVIKGSEQVAGWTRVEKDVWKVTLANSFFGDFNPYSNPQHHK
jgi:hypothetical protein